MAKAGAVVDAVVVGGGLAGLAVASYLGRAGHSVRLLERARALGGRAATTVHEGFSLNRGPHALYRRSEGFQVLSELGVPVPGRAPPTGGLAFHGGALHELPGSAVSLLRTSLLGLSEKATLARWMGRVASLDAKRENGVTLSEWLDRERILGTVRSLLLALFRLTTYSNAPDEMSAGTALLQLQRALDGGVIYVDGGWQTLVDGLAVRARASSVQITTGVGARGVTPDASGAPWVTLDDGSTLAARSVVLACDPEEAGRLLGSAGAEVPEGLRSPRKVRIATLDVALLGLPRPDRTFVLGIDQPLYLSVHSATAKLAPEGGALVHVAKYLGADGSNPEEDRRELEALLDAVQPGFRKRVVHSQYLPRITAAERLDLAADGGARGRPAAAFAALPGVFFAGDWVQGGACLADASLGSGRSAAREIVLGLERRRSVA